MESIKKSNEFDNINDNNNDIKLDYYFDSYSNYGIHQEMLSDKIRTFSYKNSILKNKDLFKNKIVLDIGCGSGILSLFAAQAGAKHVYGIEKADIYKIAKQIIKKNNFSDKITIINNMVENCELPVDKVDIIISEWMGYGLLYESMLDSVLYARDKWLIKDGLILPNKAKLYIAGIEDLDYKNDKLEFWNKQYGFNMSPMKQLVKQDVIIDIINKDNIITTKSLILDLNLNTCTKEDLDFCNHYSVKSNYNDQINGFIIWFDCFFKTKNTNIILSTSPFKYPTHWKQSIFYINDDIPLFKNEKITGSISFNKNKCNQREIDIKFSYHCTIENNKYNKVQLYKIK